MGGRMTKDYAASDLKLVFEHSHPHTWNDALKWVESEGVGNARLTPGEVDAMKEDLQKMKDDHVPFTDNYEKAYETAHKNRG